MKLTLKDQAFAEQAKRCYQHETNLDSSLSDAELAECYVRVAKSRTPTQSELVNAIKEAQEAKTIPSKLLTILVTTQEHAILEPLTATQTYETTTRLVNYNNRDDRRWLSNHMLWAFSHNLQVVTSPYVNV